MAKVRDGEQVRTDTGAVRKYIPQRLLDYPITIHKKQLYRHLVSAMLLAVFGLDWSFVDSDEMVMAGVSLVNNQLSYLWRFFARVGQNYP